MSDTNIAVGLGDSRPNSRPSTVKRRPFFKPFALRGMFRQSLAFEQTERDAPREAAPPRLRDVERRQQIKGRIAKTPRPAPLRKRNQLLAAKCDAAGVRNAAGLALSQRKVA